MAILNAFPGISAQILIDDEPIHEHPDTDEIEVEHPSELVARYQAARTVSCYIESITDMNFSISVAVGPPVGFKQEGKRKMAYTKLGFHLTIDGVHAGDAWCERPWFKKNPNRTTWRQTIEGVEEGRGIYSTVKKFKLAKIETTDIPTKELAQVKRLKQRLQKIGVIEIRVFSENYGKPGGDTQATSEGFLDSDDDEIPEKALKGDPKSHSTSLEDAEAAMRGKVHQTDKTDGEDYPIVIFRFMYRSQEALKQLHILPRTPSPSPEASPSPEPANSMTAAQASQIAELLKSFAAQNQETNGKKPRGSDGRNNVKIKRERPTSLEKGSKKAKRAKFRSEDMKELIVISDSDDDQFL